MESDIVMSDVFPFGNYDADCFGDSNICLGNKTILAVSSRKVVYNADKNF